MATGPQTSAAPTAGNNDRKAIIYGNKAIAIFRKLKDAKSEGYNLVNISLKYIGISNFTSAFKAADDALRVTTLAKDSVNIARSYALMADCYYHLENNRKDNTRKAISYLEKAFEINRKMKDSVGLVHNITVGSIKYMKEGEFKRALQLLNEAKTIAIKTKQTYQISAAQSQIASCYFLLKDWDRAIAAYKESLAEFRKSEDPSDDFMALINIGEIYIQTKRYKEALPYMEKTLA